MPSLESALKTISINYVTGVKGLENIDEWNQLSRSKKAFKNQCKTFLNSYTGSLEAFQQEIDAAFGRDSKPAKKANEVAQKALREKENYAAAFNASSQEGFSLPPAFIEAGQRFDADFNALKKLNNPSYNLFAAAKKEIKAFEKANARFILDLSIIFNTLNQQISDINKQIASSEDLKEKNDLQSFLTELLRQKNELITKHGMDEKTARKFLVYFPEKLLLINATNMFWAVGSKYMSKQQNS